MATIPGAWLPPAASASGAPSMAEASCCCSSALGAAGKAREAWELSCCPDAEDGEGQSGGARQVWQAGQPTAAAALLARCQETLDLTRRKPLCFVKFSEVEKMTNIQAEINESFPVDQKKPPLVVETLKREMKKLKTEILQLEKETADIAHPFYLGNKCEILQDMNRHLEAVLKKKRALRKRLIKPRCEESLPIEATFHRYIVDLLADAVAFIEELERHLQTVKSIPQIPNIMKNMDTALARTELLVMDLEELAEQILKWRELQKEAYSDDICNTAELDLGLSLT